MIKKFTCIECPKGCSLLVDIENCRVIKVSQNQCPKGEQYAKSEIENPVRILTSTVLASGLSLKMIPVRTDRPIPKTKIQEAMNEIKKLKITTPVHAQDVIFGNFLGLGVNLIATRESS
jgi:CxxC motif-containing protein